MSKELIEAISNMLRANESLAHTAPAPLMPTWPTDELRVYYDALVRIHLVTS